MIAPPKRQFHTKDTWERDSLKLLNLGARGACQFRVGGMWGRKSIKGYETIERIDGINRTMPNGHLIGDKMKRTQLQVW